MLLNTVSLLLLLGILLGPYDHQVNAAPTTYDQRQNGDLNVDAKFENFLILVATSGSSNLFSNFAAQASELGELIAERSKIQENPSKTTVYETENTNDGKEPYHVDIVHIEKEDKREHSNKLFDLKSKEDVEGSTFVKTAENSNNLSRSVTNSELLVENVKTGKTSRSLWNTDLEQGTIVDFKAENGNLHKENLHHNPVKLETLENSDKSEIMLKKKILKNEEQKGVHWIPERKNNLGNNYQELVLIGGGIENCGPGRYRDQSGICQNDKNFNDHPIY